MNVYVLSTFAHVENLPVCDVHRVQPNKSRVWYHVHYLHTLGEKTCTTGFKALATTSKNSNLWLGVSSALQEHTHRSAIHQHVLTQTRSLWVKQGLQLH